LRFRIDVNGLTINRHFQSGWIKKEPAVAQSNSDIFDLPVFDPDKNGFTLEQNHANAGFKCAIRIEFAAGAPRMKFRAVHPASFSRL
jgi:hypothetical protein